MEMEIINIFDNIYVGMCFYFACCVLLFYSGYKDTLCVYALYHRIPVKDDFYKHFHIPKVVPPDEKIMVVEFHTVYELISMGLSVGFMGCFVALCIDRNVNMVFIMVGAFVIGAFGFVISALGGMFATSKIDAYFRHHNNSVSDDTEKNESEEKNGK